MLEQTTIDALDSILAGVADTIRAAYELGATNVHIFLLPEHVKLAIVADDAFADPFTEAYPEYPLVPVPPTSEKSKPMFCVFFPIPTLAEQTAEMLAAQDAVTAAAAIVGGN